MKQENIEPILDEIWMPVLDYEGLYEVSNMGRVKSLAKNWITGKNIKLAKLDTILKSSIGSGGYLCVSLCKNGKVKSKTVHRLVWESFNGKTNLSIDHIVEGNRFNNKLSNLQAISHRENGSKYQKTKNKSSKYTGVCYIKKSNKWMANIQINGNKKFLGFFNEEYNAAEAYQKALKMYVIDKVPVEKPKIKLSKYLGVGWYKNRNKWVARIYIDKKVKFLGYFDDELDAHRAYQKAKILFQQ